MEPRVFISYTREDSEWVKRFADGLKRRNVDVWLDTWKLKPGDRVVEATEEALRSSDAIVSILTRDNVRRPSVLFEFGAAVGMGKRFIPIVADDLEAGAVPFDLRTHMYLTKGQPEEAAGKVADALGSNGAA